MSSSQWWRRTPILSPAEILAERPTVSRDRPAQAARVLRVVARQRLQDQRAVLDGPRERPAVIERVRVGDDAGAAHQPERGHQADDAAERRRAPDRSAGVRAERHRDQPGGDGGARARRGAAREVREVPRIARRRPRQIERRAGVRHLVGGQLAEEHGAGVVEPARRGGVLGGNPVDEDARVARRQDALRVVDVLQRERDAVQRAAVLARGDLGLGRAAPGARARSNVGRDEGARLRVVLLDAPDQRLGQLHRRQLSRLDQCRQLGDRRGRGAPWP